MEFVFVVPRSELFPECAPHGLALFGSGLDAKRFEEAVALHGYFVERAWAERNPRVKQIIPYTVVTRRSEILLLRRTKRGGEARLHDKLSIGVGGHVNPVDLGAEDRAAAPRRNPLPLATVRELREELTIEGSLDARPVGILNDDTNPVGAVHLGLVQSLAVERACEVRETDQLEGSWISIAALREQVAEGANFETWSSLLIPHLETLIHGTAAERVA